MKKFFAYSILALGLLGVAQMALATNTARMTLTPDGPIDFGDVLMGTFVDHTVNIRNDGSANLTGTINMLSSPFGLVGDGGTFTVKPGATYALTVRCAPTSVGAFRRTLEIVDTNDPNTPTKTITLLCNGIGPEVTILSSEAVNFGEVVVGSNADRDFTIRNDGTEPLRGTVYAPNSPFSLSRGEGAFELAPGRTYTVTARCTPPNRGAFRGTIEIRGINDADEPSKTIILNCVGIAPEITVLPSDAGLSPGPHLTLDFGPGAVGQAIDLPFEIRNDGERPLQGTINAPTPNPPFSIVSGGGSFRLNPGEKRTVILRCQLRTPRDATAGTLTITGMNDVDEPTKTVALNCGRAAPNISVDPLRVDFGSQQQGTLSEIRNVTIRNSGSAPLQVTNVYLSINPTALFAGAAFILIRPATCPRFPCTLMPGESLAFGLRARPNRLGIITGNLRIMSNDPDERTVDVPLQVIGTNTAGSSNLSTVLRGMKIHQTKHALEFTVTSADIAELSVALYDLRGRKIAEVSSESGQLRLEMLDHHGRPLANGVYFYVVTYKGTDGTVLQDRIKRLVLLR
ncbi:MAG: choice-of-anchor D domain-containing protein [Candidatus Bipolaricaulota bacterium]|nr:choice-of-anchor D domain-containing protein [Candidatus Bipolaricaulota bacterium]